MARRLFERQGIRRRAGALATGVSFLVWADEAATVGADIAMTALGPTVASQVTVAAIAGLGPSSLRFYGPATGVDTLYLTSPDDPTLGVQEIHSAEDPRLDLLAESPLSAKDAPFGAVGNGITDDTAALQTWVTYLAVNGKAGFLPAGNYRITAKLNIPRRPSWSIRGVDRAAVLITQATDNTPIFDIGTDDASILSFWEISGISFTYTNIQPAANTNAVPIRFTKESLQGKLVDLWFQRGYYGIGTSSSGVIGPWATTFDRISFGSGLTGGAINLQLSAGGGPNNKFGRLGVDADNMVGPIFVLTGGTNAVDTIEVFQAFQGAQLFKLGAGSLMDIGTISLEGGTYTAIKSLMEFQDNCRVHIGHVSIGGVVMTINVPGSKINLLEIGSGGHLRVEDILADALPITGSAYVAHAAGTMQIGHLTLANGWELQDNGTTTSSERITVDNWANGHLSADKGNADYTVTLGDPTIATFQTPFSAQRTITLPDNGDNLHNGLSYELVFNGAINGANTALIKGGSTLLRTQTVDRVVLRYTWRRHTIPSSGWVLTKYQPIRDAVSSDVKRRTAGNVTIGAGSWGNVDTGLDITLPAATGDKIEVSLSGVWANDGVNGFLDVVTLVSGSPVTSFSNGTGTPATWGIAGWAGLASVFSNTGTSVILTLGSGDVSGGNVVLRLRGFGDGGSKDLFASTVVPLMFSAKNLGPG